MKHEIKHILRIENEERSACESKDLHVQLEFPVDACDLERAALRNLWSPELYNELQRNFLTHTYLLLVGQVFQKAVSGACPSVRTEKVLSHE